MPIRENRADDLDQECIKCGNVVAIALSAIAAGLSRSGQANPNVVAMPVCAVCGSAEFLLRSPDDEVHPSEGSYGHKHKLLVDKLHAKLVQRGRLGEGLTPEQVPTKEPPAADLDKWFKDGLKLPPPPFQDESGRSEPK
jgi:hypothetical protein